MPCARVQQVHANVHECEERLIEPISRSAMTAIVMVRRRQVVSVGPGTRDPLRNGELRCVLRVAGLVCT